METGWPADESVTAENRNFHNVPRIIVSSDKSFNLIEQLVESRETERQCCPCNTRPTISSLPQDARTRMSFAHKKQAMKQGRTGLDH